MCACRFYCFYCFSAFDVDFDVDVLLLSLRLLTIRHTFCTYSFGRVVFGPAYVLCAHENPSTSTLAPAFAADTLT